MQYRCDIEQRAEEATAACWAAQGRDIAYNNATIRDKQDAGTRQLLHFSSGIPLNN